MGRGLPLQLLLPLSFVHLLEAEGQIPLDSREGGRERGVREGERKIKERGTTMGITYVSDLTKSMSRESFFRIDTCRARGCNLEMEGSISNYDYKEHSYS